jgi:hypothetical protein
VEAVRILIKVEGVDVDAKAGDGRTPLSFAASVQGGWGSATVSAPLETGLVDINSEDKLGRTPLFWAIVSGDAATIRNLLRVPQIDIDFKMAYGYTPLLFAAVRSTGETIEMLLATGRVDVNAQDSHGRTPLSWAVGSCFPYKGIKRRLNDDLNRLYRVKALLRCPEIDATTPDAFGYSPLDWARIYNRLASIWYSDKNMRADLTPKYEAVMGVLAHHGVVVGDVPDASLDLGDYESSYSSDLKDLLQLRDYWIREVTLERVLSLGEVGRTSGSRGLPGRRPQWEQVMLTPGP